MSRWTPPPWFSELRSQWAGNSRLRIGVLAIGAIVWVQGLLMLGDATQAWRQQAASARDEIGRVQPLARDKTWPGRVDDARQQVGALRSMLWQEADLGLAEAAMQDWVRATAGKARLNIRELTASRPPAASPAAGSASVPALPPGVQPVWLRLSGALDRQALLGFMAELVRNEQVTVVDRLVLRPATQPPTAEMDLRMLAAVRGEVK
jgi:hypothetical protein